MRIYLDSCCYNRPYDDQNQPRIHLEATAKMAIQNEIKNGRHELVTSVILDYENERNPDSIPAENIRLFMETYSNIYIGNDERNNLKTLRDEIMAKGIKYADASHIACAIHARCDCLITTDDRMLHFVDERIKIITPVDFINNEGE